MVANEIVESKCGSTNGSCNKSQRCHPEKLSPGHIWSSLAWPLAQISSFHATCEIFAQVNCISRNFEQFPLSNF